VQVIKGVHDFFPYAYEFWFDHMSSVVELVDENFNLSYIKDTMENLWILFKKNSTLNTENAALEDPEASPADVSAINPKLLEFPGPIQQYIIFKHDKLSQVQRVCKPLGKRIHCSFRLRMILN
jgi:hypothetical protein